ncbi:hypothetical protein, partial [Haliscomenobacter sp.]|uniref:hypothetical protein n=1 Tax=Haliscomenobacter sp. TaxID=2717303 RepID=UPI003364B9E9
ILTRLEAHFFRQLERIRNATQGIQVLKILRAIQHRFAIGGFFYNGRMRVCGPFDGLQVPVVKTEGCFAGRLVLGKSRSAKHKTQKTIYQYLVEHNTKLCAERKGIHFGTQDSFNVA